MTLPRLALSRGRYRIFNCRSRKTVPGFAWFRVVNVFSANIRTVGFSSLSAAFGVSCSNKAVRHSWGRAGWRTLFVMRCDFPKFNVIFAPVFLKGCLTVRLRLYPLYRIRVMLKPGIYNRYDIPLFCSFNSIKVMKRIFLLPLTAAAVWCAMPVHADEPVETDSMTPDSMKLYELQQIEVTATRVDRKLRWHMPISAEKRFLAGISAATCRRCCK